MLSSLNEAMFAKIDGIVKHLLGRSNAQAIFFTDRGGNIIARQAVREFPLEDNLIALSAGSFFANQQAARILGETEFDSLTEKGKNLSIHMRSVVNDHLLLVIFGKETNHGLVKFYVEEATRSLNAALTAPADPAAPAARPTFEIDLSRDIFQRS
jgi:predicted regulator of Ras-like GTPase activity (Roadblock/LC7/MglB family)